MTNDEIRMTKEARIKVPRTKLQTPEKIQIPNSKAARQQPLEFEVWNFSGAWCLGFGVSSAHVTPIAPSLQVYE